MSSWWQDFRDEQDREPEEGPTAEELKRREAEAKSKVRMAADNLQSLWPKLKVVRQDCKKNKEGFRATMVIESTKFVITITCFDNSRPMFAFLSKPNKHLTEQQVADLIGVARRF